jgi:hypothetical protein
MYIHRSKNTESILVSVYVYTLNKKYKSMTEEIDISR